MKELVRYLAQALVSNKDAVEVTESTSDRATVYEFKVDQAEVGKVIGREGKTIHAIRTVVQGAARAQGKRVLVEVAHGRKGGGPDRGRSADRGEGQPQAAAQPEPAEAQPAAPAAPAKPPEGSQA